MYSIKQASLRSGVSIPLIRAWERRYGVVSPQRARSGYRLYDDDAIATLMRVRELTERGWTASEASRAVLSDEVTVTAEVVATAPPPAPSAGLSDGALFARRAQLVDHFIDATKRMDIAAIGAAVDEIFAQGSFESVVDDLFMPTLLELGRAWSAGDLDVTAEHTASAALHRRLSALYEAAAVSADPRVVVGLPPGARHELAALAFSVAVRRLGVGVVYLGSDVPVASWVHVIARNRTRVAVISIELEADRAAALDVAEALRTDGNGAVLAVGGSGARWDVAMESGIVVLPSRINDAAAATVRLLNEAVVS